MFIVTMLSDPPVIRQSDHQTTQLPKPIKHQQTPTNQPTNQLTN